MKKGLFMISMSVMTSFALIGCSSEGGSNNDSPKLNEVDNEQAATEEKEDQLEATIVLDWVPNTNHTGIYVAKANGYFEEEGLDVTIIEPALEGADQIVASGQAHFGISSQDSVTVARSSDIPVVSLAAIIQEHTSGFASPVEKDITSPSDFEGKTYGGWGSPQEDVMISEVMKTVDADSSTVENVTVGTSDFFVNTSREIDFQWIFYGWTGVEAEVRGEEINMIYLTDIDPVFSYYSPVIISSDSVVEEQPELVEKFMRAISRGYEFAIDHVDEAADILIEATPETDAELIRASQEWLSERYQGEAEKWGYQSTDVWSTYTEWMLDNELIEVDVPIEEAMTNQFLP
ncbi:ABC transporter substrate-binding protein [Halalkalibacter hemicellulosilyticus]|uniref:Hydroxymethylpyrimidine ABC transporter n=1 Tax=Halalkalibacter hemicellulosilyticusJCM 9152 TaxID=1236971 RepID=W4QEQ0_9BACI|nr:ABC transporter substrate-binding protein [Halalkalibacter hemicellulosilyticus]GAE30565.1 hydroxymethylpyrimidine ABC transporter [Halalkalibacter hemicellulosilyticusJCM 9152]